MRIQLYMSTRDITPSNVDEIVRDFDLHFRGQTLNISPLCDCFITAWHRNVFGVGEGGGRWGRDLYADHKYYAIWILWHANGNCHNLDLHFQGQTLTIPLDVDSWSKFILFVFFTVNVIILWFAAILAGSWI